MASEMTEQEESRVADTQYDPPTAGPSATASENEPVPAIDRMVVAFVQGAQWWEWQKTGGTMWASDRDLAWEMGISRRQDGTLGLTDDERMALIRRRLDELPQAGAAVDPHVTVSGKPTTRD